MIDPNINPHEEAIKEIIKLESEGIRLVFDIKEAVVLADLKLKTTKGAKE